MKKLPIELVFSILISNDIVRKSDAIIILEGDYYVRAYRTLELFRNGLGKYIVISGGVDDPRTGRIHSTQLANKLMSLGIPKRRIIVEGSSQNTRDQAMEVIRLAKQKKWKKLILVGSHFHQFRAFLTFLKAMEEQHYKIQIFNIPMRNISWFKKDHPITRLTLLHQEFEKIKEYKNHVVSFQKAIEYQKWKDTQK